MKISKHTTEYELIKATLDHIRTETDGVVNVFHIDRHLTKFSKQEVLLWVWFVHGSDYFPRTAIDYMNPGDYKLIKKNIGYTAEELLEIYEKEIKHEEGRNNYSTKH
jgi:hypothetical protein